MRKTLVWVILAAIVLIGFVLYRSRSRTNLNVTPDAEREIEKAKHR